MDYLKCLLEASTIEALWELHLERIDEYGFDRQLYGITRVWNQNCFGEPEDMMVLSNHPEEYTKGYVQGGLYAKAPLAKWVLRNPGPVSWSFASQQCDNGRMPDEQLEVVEFNRRFGVNAGYTIGFESDRTRERSALVLTAKPGLSQEDVDNIWDEYGQHINSLCLIFHLKAMSLPHKYARAPLTTRQREVLEWVGDGKTTQDMATIMNLTLATVEKHLRLARGTLDVQTTTQAVLKASFQKQIYVVDV